MLITLVNEAVFDATDQDGRLLHLGSGQSFALDPIATILLDAGLHVCSREELFAAVHEHIEATDQQLAEGWEALLHALRAFDFLLPEAPGLNISASLPARVRPVPHPVGTRHRADLRRQTMPQGKPLEWEVFVTGQFLNGSLPPITLAARGDACWKTMRLLCSVGVAKAAAFCFGPRDGQAREWTILCDALAPLRARLALQWQSEAEERCWRVARRELVACQCLTRLLAPTARCLLRSAAFTCYLRALGLPAVVVIGRACFQFSESAAFHAWVELDGQVVNDREALLTGYTRLMCLPVDMAMSREEQACVAPSDAKPSV